MPNSVLWICLVAVWLFVLVPMVINRGRPQVRKSTTVATSTRTLHRGGRAQVAVGGMVQRSAQRGVQAGLPERESWRMAFGLLVTLIWLYLEILRLLAILSNNR